MKEERTYLRIKKMLKGKLLPKSTAIWLGGFQAAERYLLKTNKIEKIWVAGNLFYKFN